MAQDGDDFDAGETVSTTILAIAEKYSEPSSVRSARNPHNADEELDVTADDLVRLSAHPKVVAIGEAGLDYFYDNAPATRRAEGLRRHIADSANNRTAARHP